MFDKVINLFCTDKQTFALYLQAFATIMIGILAWTAAKGQNVIAEKNARKELFKLRYENIYQETNNLFLNCQKLVEDYDMAKRQKNKKERLKNIESIQNSYWDIKHNYYKKMEFNQFLIKPKDYDKLKTFCDTYLEHVSNYIYGRREKETCPNYYVATVFNEHYEKIPKLLSSYLLHENESKLSFYIYKGFKYLKTHLFLFIQDYCPSFCEILGDIVFVLMLLGGVILTIIEFIKEILKAPIKIEHGKVNFQFKWKSKYLNRNRPWPL